MTVAAIGVDAGSTTLKVAALDAAGTLLWSRLEPASPRTAEQATALLAACASEAGPGKGAPIVATGYGRDLVLGAVRRVTEITCHARGVFAQVGGACTVLDLGGQDTKVLALGASGRVLDFAMNDRCAAGTGRFLEVTAARLGLSLEAFDAAATAAHHEAVISSTCTVFAESEMVSLLARGTPVEAIAAGLHRAMARRVAALARQVGIRPPILASGGVALSGSVRRALSRELDQDVGLPRHAQLLGAVGAALVGLDPSSPGPIRVAGRPRPV
ncbi:MAG: 2-hydroxyglutaryl-CoA dehydratase [Deltaproteobacteria bacterium]|nr:2-hydroxyglutaryl-CoA dehydratase [Deltaproteobacteria bacterium]